MIPTPSLRGTCPRWPTSLSSTENKASASVSPPPHTVKPGEAHETREPAIDHRCYRRCVRTSSNSESRSTAVWLGGGAQIGYGGLQSRDSETLSKSDRRNGSGMPSEQHRQAHTRLQGRRREGREVCFQSLAVLPRVRREKQPKRRNALSKRLDNLTDQLVSR